VRAEDALEPGGECPRHADAGPVRAPENGQEIGVRATSSKDERAIYSFDDIKVTTPLEGSN
jgi:hypothetical protein